MKNEQTKRPKILFILHLPPPIHGAAMVGKYILDSQIINKTFDCQYINLALARDLNDIGKGGWKKLITFIKLVLKVYQVIRKFNPDLCYITPNATGAAFYKDFLVMHILKRKQCKIIAHYHNKGISTKQNNLWDNWLYKRFFNKIKVILLAESLYSDFKKYVSPSDLFICPNGIPQTLLLPSIPHNKFNILFLSNMMEEKGVWTLLKACSILNDHNKKFECHFVGKWSDITEKEFHLQVEKYKLEGIVHAYGAQYGDNKNRFWQQCDLFVFPTYYHNESFPMVLLEAMQHKKACISTNEGGIPEIIVPNETGYIVPSKDATILANKIENFINDSNLCKEMGEKGFERYNQYFTLKHFEKQLIEIFKSCLK